MKRNPFEMMSWMFSMITSIICYGGTDYRYGEGKYDDRYLKEYVDEFGETFVNEFIEKTVSYVSFVEKDTFTDSEGLSYNTMHFKGDMTEERVFKEVMHYFVEKTKTHL